MVITIRNGGGAGHWLYLDCKDKRFVERYGGRVFAEGRNFYLASVEISKWVNNELKEECLFEID